MSLINSHTNYKILAIDPGLNNTGVAIFTIDNRTNTIIKIEADTIYTSTISNITGLSNKCDDRTIKLYKLKNIVKEILKESLPAIVICEGPFYNRLMPMAYGALLEVVNIIHHAVIEYNSNIWFQTVEPLMAKKAVGANYKLGKEDVKTATLRITEITSLIDINLISEHAIDAIAVGYSFILSVRSFNNE